MKRFVIKKKASREFLKRDHLWTTDLAQAMIFSNLRKAQEYKNRENTFYKSRCEVAEIVIALTSELPFEIIEGE